MGDKVFSSSTKTTTPPTVVVANTLGGRAKIENLSWSHFYVCVPSSFHTHKGYKLLCKTLSIYFDLFYPYPATKMPKNDVEREISSFLWYWHQFERCVSKLEHLVTDLVHSNLTSAGVREVSERGE